MYLGVSPEAAPHSNPERRAIDIFVVTVKLKAGEVARGIGTVSQTNVWRIVREAGMASGGLSGARLQSPGVYQTIVVVDSYLDFVGQV
jgi:hypothetical protein